MTEKISVIIPVYNAEKTIEKCVESIIYGELREIDVILVDDCSKDNSWALCQSLSARYHNVYSYRNKKNSGVSYTRNHGLAEAKGKYILFVDSDDWVSGKYALTLWENAEKHEDSLVICGLHFHDNVIGERRDYLWHQDGEGTYIVKQEQFFELQKKFHLQQLWNKIFHRDIIEQFHIRFDENQSMGEDFQFVLDYMEAAQCKQCVVVNEALYYYIRANSSSLMSQFGLIENGNEFKRLEKLLRISGSDISQVKQQYLNIVQETKLSYVYFVSRAREKKRSAKLSLIESIMQDGKAKKYYRKQRIILFKEKVVSSRGNIQKLVERTRSKLQRVKNSKIVKKSRQQLKNDEISIISQNCIGGVFYHDMGKRFLSPTINLFFKCPDFVQFVLNLEYYIDQEIRMQWEKEYPVGILGDIKIYFMHYETCTEAKEAWEKRKTRIKMDKILVFCTDTENFSKDVFEKWKSIQYPKILFSAQKWEDESCITFSHYESFGKVSDLIPKREFYKDNFLIQIANNIR